MQFAILHVAILVKVPVAEAAKQHVMEVVTASAG